MKFEESFKEKVYTALQFNGTLEAIMGSLDSNNPVIFRYLIEDYLDELSLQLEPRVLKDDEHLIWNAQVEQYFRIKDIYSEFMGNYTKWLTEKEVKLEDQHSRRG